MTYIKTSSFRVEDKFNSTLEVEIPIEMNKKKALKVQLLCDVVKAIDISADYNP